MTEEKILEELTKVLDKTNKQIANIDDLVQQIKIKLTTDQVINQNLTHREFVLPSNKLAEAYLILEAAVARIATSQFASLENLQKFANLSLNEANKVRYQ